MYLLFDIGATNLRVGVSSALKKIDALTTVETPRDFSGGVALIASLARTLSGGKRISYAAGGVPGHVDPKHGTLSCSPNLGWNRKPLRAALQRALHCPVLLENDAALAGLGEATRGAGRGKSIVMYYTVSTGIGGARIVGGAIDVAAIGFEPGHQIINVEARKANRCSDHHVPGHLEAYSSGTALKRRYGKPAEKITSQRIWNDTARLLAVGISNSIVHWSPDVVVLGGGLMQSIPLVKLRAYVNKNLTRVVQKGPHIVRAKLADRAGLEGALVFLRQHLAHETTKGLLKLQKRTPLSLS